MERGGKNIEELPEGLSQVTLSLSWSQDLRLQEHLLAWCLVRLGHIVNNRL